MAILLAVLFLIVCILLIIIVLLQKGRGGGLGAAFGGGGSSSAFGTKTGDVFTWVTIVLTALFLVLAIGATLLFRPEGGTVDPPRIVPGDKTEVQPGDERFVTVENQTPGAAVYYTLDGSDPTDKSTRWQSAFPVRAGMTVKAKAFRSGWTPSATVTATYLATKAKPKPEEEEIEATTKPTTAPAATKPAEAPATKPAEAPKAPAPATQPATEAPKAPATAPAGAQKK